MSYCIQNQSRKLRGCEPERDFRDVSIAAEMHHGRGVEVRHVLKLTALSREPCSTKKIFFCKKYLLWLKKL
jgi:hypothetical protein